MQLVLTFLSVHTEALLGKCGHNTYLTGQRLVYI